MVLVTSVTRSTVIFILTCLTLQDVHGQDANRLSGTTKCDPVAKEDWSAERREQDPVGFVTHVCSTTGRELKEKQEVQLKLAAELVRLNEQKRGIEKQRTAADRTACELRAHQYSNCFPVQIAGKCYPCRDVIVCEISRLLAECDGFNCTLKTVSDELRAAQHENEALIVSINAMKTQLVLLETRKARLTANRLRNDSSRLFASVNKLLPELSEKPTPHELRVAKFLQETPATPCQSSKTGTPSPVQSSSHQTAKPVFSQF